MVPHKSKTVHVGFHETKEESSLEEENNFKEEEKSPKKSLKTSNKMKAAKVTSFKDSEEPAAVEQKVSKPDPPAIRTRRGAFQEDIDQ